jgi:hypothetical protein
MKCSLVEDVKRFYYLFDGVFSRRYSKTILAIFAPYQVEIDILYYDTLVANIDKYQKVHIYYKRLNRFSVGIINSLCAGLALPYRFILRKGQVLYDVPVPVSCLHSEFTAALYDC